MTTHAQQRIDSVLLLNVHLTTCEDSWGCAGFPADSVSKTQISLMPYPIFSWRFQEERDFTTAIYYAWDDRKAGAMTVWRRSAR